MIATAQELLDSFETLSDADAHQVAAEILRQLTGMGQGDLSEATLVSAADELFRTLDEQEAANAPR
jgi:hypothetical protein